MIGYTQNNNPFARKTSSPLNKSYGQAYKDMQEDDDLRASYGHMDEDQYTQEAKRQAGAYKKSGGTIKDGVATGGTWDVPTVESLKETYPAKAPDIKPVDDTPSTVELTGKQKRAANKAKRIQGRIDKRPFGKEVRPGQAGRLAKAKAKAAGLSGKAARQAGKDARVVVDTYTGEDDDPFNV